MTTVTVTPARGKILAVEPAGIVFQPVGGNYRLHLQTLGGKTAAPLNTILEGVIRATVRKIYTVPGGGSFVTPIYGPPHIVQGRIVGLDEQSMVVNAGVPFHLQLPAESSAYDLSNGPLAVGALVNVVLIPGATFEHSGDFK
jgi:hypothetical protein